MKKLITLAVMLMLAASASAQSNNETQRKPKGPFSFGIGYDYAIFVVTTIENDIIGKQKVKDAYVDMHMLTLNFDYAVTPRWTAGLVTGYTGYGVPLLFEAKHFWNSDVNSSRWLTYANMGANFSGTDNIKAGMQAGIGGGYRFHIAPRFKIDLTLGYNFLQKNGEVMVANSDYIIQTGKYNGHAFTFGVGFAF
jgi:opacity protein-like surface antigen